MCLVEIGGEELEQVIEELPQELELETFEGVIKALNQHFDPFANPDRDVVLLRRTVQAEGEPFERFYRMVRDLTCRCAGLDRAFEARIQLLVGCKSDKQRDVPEAAGHHNQRNSSARTSAGKRKCAPGASCT